MTSSKWFKTAYFKIPLFFWYEECTLFCSGHNYLTSFGLNFQFLHSKSIPSCIFSFTNISQTGMILFWSGNQTSLGTIRSNDGNMKSKGVEILWIWDYQTLLTLFRPGGGHYGPHYHESVCRCRKVRATFTKLPDFVPFNVCQVQESQFWCLFFKKLKNIDVKNFWGSSSIRWKSEKIENFFFY